MELAEQFPAERIRTRINDMYNVLSGRPNVALQIGGQSYTVYKVPEYQTNVVFTCTSGPDNPAITGYSWRHNSNILVNEVTNTYTISSVSQSHDGTYTCSATNVEGTGTSAAMDLDVLCKLLY